MLALVVAKKIRDELSVFPELALRAGIVIAGAKAQLLLAACAARLKPCPDTKRFLTYATSTVAFFPVVYVPPSVRACRLLLVGDVKLARLHALR
jgi:hypothetical protein